MKSKMITIAMISMVSISYSEIVSLKKAIDLSFQSDESILIDEEYQINKSSIKEFESFSKPKLSFSTRAMYIDNSAQGQTAQMGFDIGELLGGGNNNGAATNSVDRLKGMSYGWNLNASQTLNLFKINSTVKMSTIQSEIVQHKKDSQKEDLKIKVIDAYWNALIAQDELQISLESEKWQKDQYEKAKISLELGRLPKVTFNLIESMYNLTLAQKKSKESQKELAIKQLKTLIGFSGEIELNDEIEIRSFSNLKTPHSDGNKTIKMLQKQADFNEQNASYEKAGFYPDVELLGSISNTLVGYDTKKWSVLDDYANPDFFNYSIGIQLNWSIFSGGNTVAKVEQLEIQSRLQNRQANLMKKEFDDQLVLIKSNLENLESIISAQEVYAQSLKSTLESDRIEFQENQRSLSDVIQSEKNYSESRMQLLSHKKNWLISKVNFEKLSGIEIEGEL